MPKMSITRALVELKLLEARIRKTQRNPMVTLIVGGKEIPQTLPLIDTQAFLQAKTDLMKRRADIKLAIMLSNASTKVTINGKKMTVLEAIERKATIQYEKEHVVDLKRVLIRNTETVSIHNQESKRVLSKILESAASSGALEKDASDSITKNHNEKNEMTMSYGKVNLPEQITTMEEAIEAFEGEVDFVLSASNATTNINVD